MQRYIFARFLSGAVTLWLITVIVFGLVNFVPGDIVDVLQGDAGFTRQEAQAIRHQMGLDRPLPERYASWLRDASHLQFGTSLKTGQPVRAIMGRAAPVTAELTLLTITLAVAIGIPLGTWSAVRQDKPDDYLLRLLAIGGVSIPSFWVATLVVVLPAIWFGWAPPLTYVPFAEDPLANLQELLLPAAILGLDGAAVLMRYARSTVLEVLREDYTRTARAKGLSGLLVIRRHVLRNALLPVVTVLGGQVVFLISGAIVLETIFSLPGIGSSMLRALRNRDFPIISGLNLMVGTAIVVVNLAVDLVYAVIDPRVKY